MTLPVDLSSTGAALAMGIAALVLGLLLVRIGRALGVLLAVLGLVALLGLLAVALFHQSEATAATATAAVVATAGQAVSNVAVTVLAVLLVVVLLAGGVAVLYLLRRLRLAERQGRWLPGPNARWGRAGEMLPVPWWAYLPPPWWRYPPPMRWEPQEPSVYVIEDEDEEPGLDALPWGGEGWEW